MFQNLNKSFRILAVALLIGSIGAVGQAYLLYHELVDCYPYKVVDYPFYKGIADVGAYLAPFAAILVGLGFGLKRFSLALILPVITCPLIFALVFKTISVLNEWDGVVADWSFDGKTPSTAAQGFFTYSISLAIVGSVVATICAFLLTHQPKPKKLV